MYHLSDGGQQTTHSTNYTSNESPVSHETSPQVYYAGHISSNTGSTTTSSTSTATASQTLSMPTSAHVSNTMALRQWRRSNLKATPSPRLSDSGTFIQSSNNQNVTKSSPYVENIKFSTKPSNTDENACIKSNCCIETQHDKAINNNFHSNQVIYSQLDYASQSGKSPCSYNSNKNVSAYKEEFGQPNVPENVNFRNVKNGYDDNKCNMYHSVYQHNSVPFNPMYNEIKHPEFSSMYGEMSAIYSQNKFKNINSQKVHDTKSSSENIRNSSVLSLQNNSYKNDYSNAISYQNTEPIRGEFVNMKSPINRNIYKPEIPSQHKSPLNYEYDYKYYPNNNYNSNLSVPYYNNNNNTAYPGNNWSHFCDYNAKVAKQQTMSPSYPIGSYNQHLKEPQIKVQRDMYNPAQSHDMKSPYYNAIGKPQYLEHMPPRYPINVPTISNYSYKHSAYHWDQSMTCAHPPKPTYPNFHVTENHCDNILINDKYPFHGISLNGGRIENSTNCAAAPRTANFYSQIYSDGHLSNVNSFNVRPYMQNTSDISSAHNNFIDQNLLRNGNKNVPYMPVSWIENQYNTSNYMNSECNYKSYDPKSANHFESVNKINNYYGKQSFENLKSGLNLKQFLETWDDAEENEENNVNNLPDVVLSTSSINKNENISDGEEACETNSQSQMFYVLESTNISAEVVQNNYKHIQQIDKLPDNIKLVNDSKKVADLTKENKDFKEINGNQKEVLTAPNKVPINETMIFINEKENNLLDSMHEQQHNIQSEFKINISKGRNSTLENQNKKIIIKSVIEINPAVNDNKMNSGAKSRYLESRGGEFSNSLKILNETRDQIRLIELNVKSNERDCAKENLSDKSKNNIEKQSLQNNQKIIEYVISDKNTAHDIQLKRTDTVIKSSNNSLMSRCVSITSETIPEEKETNVNNKTVIKSLKCICENVIKTLTNRIDSSNRDQKESVKKNDSIEMPLCHANDNESIIKDTVHTNKDYSTLSPTSKIENSVEFKNNSGEGDNKVNRTQETIIKLNNISTNNSDTPDIFKQDCQNSKFIPIIKNDCDTSSHNINNINSEKINDSLKAKENSAIKNNVNVIPSVSDSNMINEESILNSIDNLISENNIDFLPITSDSSVNKINIEEGCIQQTDVQNKECEIKLSDDNSKFENCSDLSENQNNESQSVTIEQKINDIENIETKKMENPRLISQNDTVEIETTLVNGNKHITEESSENIVADFKPKENNDPCENSETNSVIINPNIEGNAKSEINLIENDHVPLDKLKHACGNINENTDAKSIDSMQNIVVSEHLKNGANFNGESTNVENKASSNLVQNIQENEADTKVSETHIETDLHMENNNDKNQKVSNQIKEDVFLESMPHKNNVTAGEDDNVNVISNSSESFETLPAILSNDNIDEKSITKLEHIEGEVLKNNDIDEMFIESPHSNYDPSVTNTESQSIFSIDEEDNEVLEILNKDPLKQTENEPFELKMNSPCDSNKITEIVTESNTLENTDTEHFNISDIDPELSNVTISNEKNTVDFPNVSQDLLEDNCVQNNHDAEKNIDPNVNILENSVHKNDDMIQDDVNVHNNTELSQNITDLQTDSLNTPTNEENSTCKTNMKEFQHNENSTEMNPQNHSKEIAGEESVNSADQENEIQTCTMEHTSTDSVDKLKQLFPTNIETNNENIDSTKIDLVTGGSPSQSKFQGNQLIFIIQAYDSHNYKERMSLSDGEDVLDLNDSDHVIVQDYEETEITMASDDENNIFIQIPIGDDVDVENPTDITQEVDVALESDQIYEIYNNDITDPLLENCEIEIKDQSSNEPEYSEIIIPCRNDDYTESKIPENECDSTIQSNELELQSNEVTESKSIIDNTEITSSCDSMLATYYTFKRRESDSCTKYASDESDTTQFESCNEDDRKIDSEVFYENVGSNEIENDMVDNWFYTEEIITSPKMKTLTNLKTEYKNNQNSDISDLHRKMKLKRKRDKDKKRNYDTECKPSHKDEAIQVSSDSYLLCLHEREKIEMPTLNENITHQALQSTCDSTTKNFDLKEFSSSQERNKKNLKRKYENEIKTHSSAMEKNYTYDNKKSKFLYKSDDHFKTTAQYEENNNKIEKRENEVEMKKTEECMPIPPLKIKTAPSFTDILQGIDTYTAKQTLISKFKIPKLKIERKKEIADEFYPNNKNDTINRNNNSSVNRPNKYKHYFLQSNYNTKQSPLSNFKIRFKHGIDQHSGKCKQINNEVHREEIEDRKDIEREKQLKKKHASCNLKLEVQTGTASKHKKSDICNTLKRKEKKIAETITNASYFLKNKASVKYYETMARPSTSSEKYPTKFQCSFDDSSSDRNDATIIPKVIIKRSTVNNKYASTLSDTPLNNALKWQPFVKLQRNYELDRMAVKLKLENKIILHINRIKHNYDSQTSLKCKIRLDNKTKRLLPYFKDNHYK